MLLRFLGPGHPVSRHLSPAIVHWGPCHAGGAPGGPDSSVASDPLVARGQVLELDASEPSSAPGSSVYKGAIDRRVACAMPSVSNPSSKASELRTHPPLHHRVCVTRLFASDTCRLNQALFPSQRHTSSEARRRVRRHRVMASPASSSRSFEIDDNSSRSSDPPMRSAVSSVDAR